MYKYYNIVNNTNVNHRKKVENRMTVDDRKKKTFIDKLLFVFKPRRSADIVTYADRIIDDYTGLTALRIRRRDRRLRRAAVIASLVSCVAFLGILCCILKIFF